MAKKQNISSGQNKQLMKEAGRSAFHSSVIVYELMKSDKIIKEYFDHRKKSGAGKLNATFEKLFKKK